MTPNCVFCGEASQTCACPKCSYCKEARVSYRCGCTKRDQAFYNAVYDLLIQHGGAPDRDAYFENYHREAFVGAYTMVPTGYPREWRCVPKLGFGGKFWRNAGRFYVSYYPEDKTPEREVTLARINALIDELVAQYNPNPDP
jgi:hypothetical protein